MAEYLLKITGIVLISTVLTNVLPTGQTSVLIKNIIRLCAYIAVLSPAVDFFSDYLSSDGKNFQNYFAEDVIQTDNSYIQYCSEKTIENAERSLEEYLQTEYSILTNVTVLVDEKNSDNSNIKIKNIQIQGADISAEIQEKIGKDFQERFSVDIQFAKGG